MDTELADVKFLLAALGIESRAETLANGKTVLFASITGLRAYADNPLGDPNAHALLDQFIAAEHADGRIHADDELTIPFFRTNNPAGGPNDHS